LEGLKGAAKEQTLSQARQFVEETEDAEGEAHVLLFVYA